MQIILLIFIKNQISVNDLKSGLDIESSLDFEFNESMQERIRFYLNKYGNSRVSNGALLAIDNRTGEIIAYVGSNDFNDKEKSGENRRRSNYKPARFDIKAFFICPESDKISRLQQFYLIYPRILAMKIFIFR